VLIATPGRLLDHMQYAYAELADVETLVLDEADRMLDMGFLPDVKRIFQRLPEQNQMLFFSATLPGEVVRLTRQWLLDPVTINLEREAKPAEGITHSIYPVPHQRKSSLLLHILRGDGVRNALVFARTKRRAERVAEYLKNNGVRAARIHGDRTQAQRTQAMDGFKNGRYRVLVATDVAARGIDIEGLTHVINFDVPACADSYIHRVGRTARAEATGDAFTFVSPEQEGDLTVIERKLGAKLPRVVLQDFDYSVAENGQLSHAYAARGADRQAAPDFRSDGEHTTSSWQRPVNRWRRKTAGGSFRSAAVAGAGR
jgi:ATP-dependent RNA helicase RhlE